MMIKTCGECPVPRHFRYHVWCDDVGQFDNDTSVPDKCPMRGKKMEWPEKVEEIPTK